MATYAMDHRTIEHYDLQLIADRCSACTSNKKQSEHESYTCPMIHCIQDTARKLSDLRMNLYGKTAGRRSKDHS